MFAWLLASVGVDLRTGHLLFLKVKKQRRLKSWGQIALSCIWLKLMRRYRAIPRHPCLNPS